jgi:DivIVA domain-containing protein
VLGFVFFVVGVLVVGGLLFLGASLLLGRGETQPPADLDRSPVELPDGRPVTGDDVRALRISVTVRGYRMAEVDWLLEQFAEALDERDAALAERETALGEREAEIARLRAARHPHPAAEEKEGTDPGPDEEERDDA